MAFLDPRTLRGVSAKYHEDVMLHHHSGNHPRFGQYLVCYMGLTPKHQRDSVYQQPCSFNNLKKISFFMVVELFLCNLCVELHHPHILKINKQVETSWILM